MADEKETVKTENGAEQTAEPLPEEKKTITQKLAAFLMSRDYKAIFRDVYRNILSPELRKIAFNSIMAVVRDLIFKGSIGPDAPLMSEYRDYTGYSSSEAPYYPGETHRYVDKNEVFAKSRQEAEDILRRLRLLLKEKGIVTVADYHQIARKPVTFTEYELGWNSLDKVSIYPLTRGGERLFGFRFPDPMHIDRSGN